MDIFGVPLPSFNVKGKDKIQSAFGGIMTATVFILTLGYFITGFRNIADRENPILNQSTIQNYYIKEKDGLYLNEAN